MAMGVPCIAFSSSFSKCKSERVLSREVGARPAWRRGTQIALSCTDAPSSVLLLRSTFSFLHTFMNASCFSSSTDRRGSCPARPNSGGSAILER